MLEKGKEERLRRLRECTGGFLRLSVEKWWRRRIGEFFRVRESEVDPNTKKSGQSGAFELHAQPTPNFCSHKTSLLLLFEETTRATKLSYTRQVNKMSATTEKPTSSQPKVEKAALLDDEGDLTPKVSVSATRRSACHLFTLTDLIALLRST